MLSLNLWLPLSRLTFSAYLIHSTMIYNHYYSQDHPIHGQDYNMVNFFHISYYQLNILLLFFFIKHVRFMYISGIYQHHMWLVI